MNDHDTLVARGVRLPESLIARVNERNGVTLSAAAREALEQWLNGPPDRPELMGATEAAATLLTTTSNLGKIAGLPEPLYSPTHPDPRYRLKAGKFYDADAIRALAESRRRR